jgi:predicted protein tyrosine phosphatase
MIHVCSLTRLYDTVQHTGSRHVVTLMRDQVPWPAGRTPANYLVLRMDDISAPIDGHTMPCEEHVGRLIDFARGWDRATPMVVHCYAGISRSTAAAYVAACALNPAGDEMVLAQKIRRLSATATPNIRIVTLADRVLGRGGRMVDAISSIGRGEMAYEGVPFRLDFD